MLLPGYSWCKCKEYFGFGIFDFGFIFDLNALSVRMGWVPVDGWTDFGFIFDLHVLSVRPDMLGSCGRTDKILGGFGCGMPDFRFRIYF
jgi:hypothetical protein